MDIQRHPDALDRQDQISSVIADDHNNAAGVEAHLRKVLPRLIRPHDPKNLHHLSRLAHRYRHSPAPFVRPKLAFTNYI